MPTWEEMSKEEREQYVNQDQKRQNWRERLAAEMGQERFLGQADVSGMGVLTTGDTSWIFDLMESSISPVDLECLRLFYIEGRTYREIASSVQIQYLVDGEVVQVNTMKEEAVRHALRKGRKAIIDWKRCKNTHIHS